jgi:flagellar motility protein MotE (MotC chaperone)
VVEKEVRDWLNKIESKLDTALERTSRQDERLKAVEKGQAGMIWWVRSITVVVAGAVIKFLLDKFN